MIMPVPAASFDPTVVLMSTMAGLILAAMADVRLPFEDPPDPGETGAIGDVEGSVCAIWCELIARARLHPTPAPAPAATMATRTTHAAIRPQTEEAGGGGGAGAQAGADGGRYGSAGGSS